MRRSVATLVLVLFAAPAWAKPKIAILGLEPVDTSGKATGVTASAASELTKHVRDRAKIGVGPYELAPGSEVDLAKEKKAANCASEAVQCMAPIGANLGADVLMYGRLEKTKSGYELSIKLIDVAKKRVLGAKYGATISDADASSALELAAFAKTIYTQLTGTP